MRNNDDINANPRSTLNLVSRPSLARPCHVHIITWSGNLILAKRRSLRPHVGLHRAAGGNMIKGGSPDTHTQPSRTTRVIVWEYIGNDSPLCTLSYSIIRKHPLFQPRVIRKYYMLYLWASPNLRVSSSKSLCELAKAPCHARFPTSMVKQRLWVRLPEPMPRHMYLHQTVCQGYRNRCIHYYDQLIIDRYDIRACLFNLIKHTM